MALMVLRMALLRAGLPVLIALTTCSFSAFDTYKGNCISNWSLMTNSASTLYTATDVSVK